MKRIFNGALIGMGIGVIISWIIRLINPTNIFGDHLIGFISSGDILLIIGFVSGGLAAYFIQKKSSG